MKQEGTKQEGDEEGRGLRRKGTKKEAEQGTRGRTKRMGRDRMEWEQAKYETDEAGSEQNRKRAKRDMNVKTVTNLSSFCKRKDPMVESRQAPSGVFYCRKLRVTQGMLACWVKRVQHLWICSGI